MIFWKKTYMLRWKILYFCFNQISFVLLSFYFSAQIIAHKQDKFVCRVIKLILYNHIFESLNNMHVIFVYLHNAAGKGIGHLTASFFFFVTRFEPKLIRLSNLIWNLIKIHGAVH